MRIISGAFLLLFIGAIGIFCFQNQGTVTVTFLNRSLTVTLPIVVLLVYLLGMISGWGVLSIVRRSLRTVAESRH